MTELIIGILSVFHNSQYGFRLQHSTIHAVNEFIDETITYFENKQYTMDIFLDISKAFDTIDHNMLHKLRTARNKRSGLGVIQKLCVHQYAQYTNFKSDTEMIPCRVPQGSALGP